MLLYNDYLPKRKRGKKEKKLPMSQRTFLYREVKPGWGGLPKNIILYMRRNDIKTINQLLKTHKHEDLWIKGVLHSENMVRFVRVLVDYRVYHRYKNP